jgi:hypothetical protein
MPKTRTITIHPEVIEAMAIGNDKALIELTSRTAKGSIVRYVAYVPKEFFKMAAEYVDKNQCLTMHERS